MLMHWSLYIIKLSKVQLQLYNVLYIYVCMLNQLKHFITRVINATWCLFSTSSHIILLNIRTKRVMFYFKFDLSQSLIIFFSISVQTSYCLNRKYQINLFMYIYVIVCIPKDELILCVCVHKQLQNWWNFMITITTTFLNRDIRVGSCLS